MWDSPAAGAGLRAETLALADRSSHHLSTREAREMRMWMVNPRLLCRRHLLGEHVELHMFAGHIRLKRNVDGYVNGNLLESSSIKSRHEQLVKEMERRGYHHSSPLKYQDRLRAGKVNRKAALAELLKRCPECKARSANG